MISAGTLDLAIVTLVEATRSAAVLSCPRLQWVAASRFVFEDCTPLPVAFHPERLHLARDRDCGAPGPEHFVARSTLCRQ